VGDDEFLLDTEDPAAVARHIVLAQQVPPSQRPVRAKKAARFSWSKIGESYREFLQEVVEQAASS